MRRRVSSIVLRYGFAVGTWMAAVLLRLAATPALGLRLRYLLFVPVVMVSGWFGGLGPGLLATSVSGLAIVFLWLPPVYSFAIHDRIDIIGLVLFLASGLIITALNEQLHEAGRRARADAEALRREMEGRQKAEDTAAVLADLTEKLRESERRYRLLFERNLAGVLWTRSDGAILDCNEAFARILGYTSREDVLSQRVSDFYVDPAERTAVLAGLEPGGTADGREVYWRRRDGTPTWLRVNLRRTQEGSYEGIIIDVSDQKRALEAEREAAELRATATLAAAAGHEINNPLAVLFGHLSMLGKEQAGNPRLEKTLEAAERIRDIVARMTRITRVEMVRHSSPGLPPMLDIRKSSEPPE